jgi:hypothetical protein
MPSDEYVEAVKLTAAAAAMGGAVRVALALRSGVRRAGLLVIEGLVGGAVGPLGAGIVLVAYPQIADGEHAMFKLLAVAGLCGAIGLRLLLLIEDEVRRRIGARAREDGKENPG